jgi:hypothetical protein
VSQVENRSWLLGPHGTEPGTTPSITIDVSKFTKASHYPNDYVPSGIVLGKVTATGLYGPYDSTALDGREVAAGHLFGSLPIRTGSTKVGGALVVHAFVNPDKLPIADATAGGGFLTTAARTALNLIHYSK